MRKDLIQINLFEKLLLFQIIGILVFAGSSSEKKGKILAGNPVSEGWYAHPDVMFAKRQFYLITQTNYDYVSPEPWVETVKVLVGVDTNNNGSIDYWDDWQEVIEKYDYLEGFAKQVDTTPAQLYLSELPEGYGFQFKIKIINSTENESKPVIDKVVVNLAV